MKQKPILVIGGGISGITTTIEAAETGCEVILVEKLPYLGGRVAKMNQYFPKLCPPYCGLEINFNRIKKNPRVKVYTSSEIEKITGEKGNFTVSIKSKPSYVNENCTSCGECMAVCPVERDDEFNYNLGKTKAIYLPHEMAFPFKYTIDGNVCEKEKCRKCEEVCKYNSIDLTAQEETQEINVGGIIIATGWKPYEAEKIEGLDFGTYENVITNVMMERLAAQNGPGKGKIIRPSDQTVPKKIAFVQCAGSRDESHLPYCSSVCCSASLKQAINYTEQVQEGKASIFYIDLRVFGRNEDFLKKVTDHENIKLIKGKAANIQENKETKGLIVEAEDIMSGRKIKEEFDMVVLATGIKPENIKSDMLVYDEYGFMNGEMEKQGIISVACAKKPVDVSASLKDATGAALKAIQLMNM